MKQFRKLASEITALGAKLSDDLRAEAEVLRDARAKAVQRAERLDLSQARGHTCVRGEAAEHRARRQLAPRPDVAVMRFAPAASSWLLRGRAEQKKDTPHFPRPSHQHCALAPTCPTLTQVETAVREAIGDTREKLDEVRRAVEELTEREGALSGKLAKRQAEVRRAEERLETLQDVRPVYMDEYEKMEGDLQVRMGASRPAAV